jgi:hypothetical protein
MFAGNYCTHSSRPNHPFKKHSTPEPAAHDGSHPIFYPQLLLGPCPVAFSPRSKEYLKPQAGVDPPFPQHQRCKDIGINKPNYSVLGDTSVIPSVGAKGTLGGIKTDCAAGTFDGGTGG